MSQGKRATPASDDESPDATPSLSTDARNAYWRSNLKLVGVLLVVWFVVSFVFSILLVETLNQIQIGGFKLGFWFAQQGSIYVYVVLVFVYAMRMHALDRQHDLDDE